MLRYVTAVFLIFASVATAEVLPPDAKTVCPNDGVSPCYRIEGRISQLDFVRIKAIADKAIGNGTALRPLFYVDSAGGDIDAALNIGRELRRLRAIVSVKDKCYSACVFLLAGAVQRIVAAQSKVGIHRAYSQRTEDRSYDVVDREQQLVRKQITAYLQEMNVSGALFDAMLRVPPGQVKILSAEELDQFGLSRDDPVKAELDDAAEARRYRISKQELYSRKALARRECGSLYSSGQYDAFYSCWYKVLEVGQSSYAK